MDDFENSKARNVIDRHGWKCSPDQASVFEQIIYGVYNNIRRGHGNAYINLELDQIWTKTQKYWIARHVAECPSRGEYM